jgi:hypothetical protein
MTRLRTAAVALAATALVTSLTGCGEEDGDGDGSSAASSTPTPSGSALACEDVWGGETLPDPYEGCTEDGAVVPPERMECSSGQVIVTFDDRYYAVPGGPVNDVGSLAESKQYRQAMRTCTA